jgi:hypothetical protein
MSSAGPLLPHLERPFTVKWRGRHAAIAAVSSLCCEACRLPCALLCRLTQNALVARAQKCEGRFALGARAGLDKVDT